MATENKVTITMGFANSEVTEDIVLGTVATSLASAVKTKVKALNTSLAGGTDDGLGTFFSDQDDNQFNKIIAAKIVTTEVTPLT